MSAILLLPLLLGACSREALEHAAERREEASLAAAVDAYWTAVQWGDAERAAAWFEAGEDQRRLSVLMATPAFRVTEARAVYVALDPRGEGTRRTGTATVHVESIDVRRSRLVTEEVEQRWYDAGRGWFVDPSGSRVAEGRPW